MKKKADKILVIVGPTASGKTGLGVMLAKKFNGEIVSADSRQVYRGLDLGTGKEGVPQSGQILNLKPEIRDKYQAQNSNKQNILLTIEQLRQSTRMIDDIPQWMIDIVEPGQRFTLFDYLPLARMVIEDILSRGKTPIIVGGTGLYVQALVEGFHLQEPRAKSQETSNVIPDLVGDPMIVDSRLRGNDNTGSGNDNTGSGNDKERGLNDNYSRKQLEQFSIEQLGDILRGISPEKFDQVDLNNPHRVIRAIEKAQAGERPEKNKPDWDVLQIGIELPREELYNRIDKRVDDRFEQGMLGEAENLLKSGVNPDWLLKLGLEYKMMTSFLISNYKFLTRLPDGQVSNQISKPKSEFQRIDSLEEMKQTLKFKIHQYARRQLTWFRRFPEIKWLKDFNEISSTVQSFLAH